ncbi:hypothetical protein A5886_001870 [Enterococcus sp. 8G7_MSG3316]|uniref:Uronate isomerase n=1 Tax=Candidatus Enterococcus testudinis TaxID=1834191 RepID=A0A242A7T8_9ENTE|nr:glucuronate isomerase [Enterococcus sp. 8G7_MSG3316]OTN76791.1 hypothetical protein A5886_001870 [Enterococcus sp. 8G7_MSG3316]
MFKENFLLTNTVAQTLYHEYAKGLPIIDYHCHLDPKEIYEDQPFKNITEAWLAGDHYKWRLMRACGIDEEKITGTASDYDKFAAWCQTVPKLIGNPLYTWTHLELQRFFAIDLPVNEANTATLWETCNQALQKKDFTRRGLIANSQVKIVCTTDDPIDDLYYHQQLHQTEDRFTVLPTFRPDKAIKIGEKDFLTYIDKLAIASNQTITTYQDLVNALAKRISYFSDNHCRLADHGIDTLTFIDPTALSAADVFEKALTKTPLTDKEVAVYQTTVLLDLMKAYHQAGWTMQLHLHAYRNCNQRMYQALGPDTGYDGINDQPITKDLQQLLDHADHSQQLPQMILYSLNPNDYDALVALMGCFQNKGANKLQLGSGWWYNDTRAGMRQQLTKFADGSVLFNFVGMLTDSRSFLSYTRHEYFRRVLCEWLAEIVLRGEAPTDLQELKPLIENICYINAARYFQFQEMR